VWGSCGRANRSTLRMHPMGATWGSRTQRVIAVKERSEGTNCVGGAAPSSSPPTGGRGRDVTGTLWHMNTEEQHATARVVSFVEPRLAEQLAELARKNDRSLSSQVKVLLRDALESKR
jgi:hypothetical protein